MLVNPLGGHVVGRTDEGVCDGRLRAEEPAQAEIADFHHALGCDEYVGRLDICPKKRVWILCNKNKLKSKSVFSSWGKSFIMTRFNFFVIILT